MLSTIKNVQRKKLNWVHELGTRVIIVKRLFSDKDKERPFEEKDKVVLIEKGQNHFDILPEGWIQVTHNSGMPLYLHKVTRVCTLAKPYFLGSGSARVRQIYKSFMKY